MSKLSFPEEAAVEITFFIAGIVALATTLRVITCTNAVHALLYLILSLIAVAIDFYTLGAPFAAVLEVIVYAGAVMVLFVFVVMMLNLNAETVARERYWIQPKIWIGPAIFSAILLITLLWALVSNGSAGHFSGEELSAHAVGSQLFGPYVLVAELAAFLLLAALAVAAHIGRDDRMAARIRAEREQRETMEAQERS